jgi:hypothetical protein
MFCHSKDLVASNLNYYVYCMHSQMLEASDKEADYSQDPSSDEVEGSLWSIKDPLTETAETSQMAWALTLQRKD